MKRTILTQGPSLLGRIREPKSSALRVELNWAPAAADLGTTLSSVAYTTDQSGVTFSDSSVASGVGSVTLTGTDLGDKLIKVTATLANGDTLVRFIYLDVDDPEVYAGADYGVYV